MAILRTIHDSHFTTVANETIRDSSLSFKAKGVLYLLLSCADNWYFTESWIATQSTDGLTAIKSALHELEERHYLKRYRARNDDGTWGEGVYEVYEKPYNPSEPVCTSPMSENPTWVNGPQRITDNNNDIKENHIKNTNCASEEIVAYLNAKANKKYRASSKQTSSLINARLKEGFRIEDFKRVIDNKVADWKNRKDMEQYLRPETLFGTKFEGYLNENREVRGVNRLGNRD